MSAVTGALRERLGPALDADRLAGLLGRVRSRLPDVTDRGLWDGIEAPTRADLLALARAELATPPPVPLASDWARAFRDGVRTAYEDAAGRLRDRAARLVVAAVLTGEVAPASAAAGAAAYLDAAPDGPGHVSHLDTSVGAGPGAAPCLDTPAAGPGHVSLDTSADAGPGAMAYLDAAADALVALAESSTWCWAPHDGFTAGRGDVLPDPDEPYLDLGAAETGALFAWADHALGPHLDTRVPGLRRRLRREVDLRVLTPFEHRRDWPWIGADGTAHNWNPWIHGAVLACALLFDIDGARRADLVRTVVAGLDHYLAVLPDDGGIDEGVAYWWQGACRLLEALDLLATAGSDLDARDLPVLAALVRFPHRMHLGGDWYVNAGDAPARLPADQPWHVPFGWARRCGDPAAAAHALARGREGLAARPAAGLGRALTALADPHWRTAHTRHATVREVGGVADGEWLERQVWLPGVQVLVARERAATASGLALAAKAGHNGERHNHLDVGSYWVALDGRPVVVDVGQPTYTAASFGPDRYRAWPVGGGWHNVPEPGAPQSPGAGHAATGVEALLADDGARLRCELSGAYPAGHVARWWRSVRLDRATETTPARVEVADRWRGAPREVLLRHVMAGEVTLAGDGALVRLDGGPTLRMSWAGARVAVRLERRTLDDPLLRRSWGGHLTRLTLAVTGGGAGTLTVRMERAR